MSLPTQSLIGYGSGSAGGRTLRGFNPATNEPLDPPFHCASAADVAAAARLAESAFLSYRDLSGARRAEFLRRIAANLEAAGDEINARATAETGLPAARITAELARTGFQFRFFADLAQEGSWVEARVDPGDPARAPAPRPDLRSMLRPLGPVAVFGAANFPLAYSAAGGDTAAALAAGCPVIAVAHEGHPGTAALAGQAIRDAAAALDMPDGVFSLLFPDGHETGGALIRDPRVRAAGFTGSRAGGTALMKLAAGRAEPIPFFAEMGSINPVFLLPGALKSRGEAIARGLHASVTTGAGQFCTKPGLVILLEDVAAEKFVAEFAALIAATPSTVMLNPGIQANYQRGSMQRAAAGIEMLHAPAASSGCLGSPALFSVTAEKFLASPELRLELFGPSTLFIRCREKPEVYVVAAALEGSLTATLHADAPDLREFAGLPALLEMKAGRLIYDGYPTGVEVGHAIVHGGPYPATGDGRSSSVGGRAMGRFARPVCYQNFPDSLLPPELRDGNPLKIWRMLDGEWVR
jgi:NADP-dependent aldehyde dehydrogenase